MKQINRRSRRRGSRNSSGQARRFKNSTPYNPNLDQTLWASDTIILRRDKGLQAQIKQYGNYKPKLRIIQWGRYDPKSGRRYVEHIVKRLDAETLDVVCRLVREGRDVLKDLIYERVL
jgi:hypothetical protein